MENQAFRVRTKEAAEYLGCAKGTLDKLRCDGTGPVYLKLKKRSFMTRAISTLGSRHAGVAQPPPKGPPRRRGRWAMSNAHWSVRKGRRYLTPKEAAEFLGLSDKTLAKWRSIGGGPVFHRIGTGRRRRIGYTETDLLAFVTRHRSTSDEGTAALAGEAA